jgi:hypothetical protein
MTYTTECHYVVFMSMLYNEVVVEGSAGAPVILSEAFNQSSHASARIVHQNHLYANCIKSKVK